MNFESPLVDLVIALGLGLLVGLQRESQARSAGLRTFALVTLGGAVAGLLVPSAGGWVVGSGLLAVAILGAIDHFNEREKGSGLTTEAAMIAMYLVGVVVTVIDERLAVVLAGTVAVLLQAKGRFRRVMEKLGDGDVRAIMQFVLLSLVILPVLPNRDYGPWGVLNPFEIWLLVVLIVGINLGGYIAWKFVRADTGVLLTGALGGVISSTATTVTYSRRTREQTDGTPISAVVIMIATAVVLVRVLIEVAVVAPQILREVVVPVSIVLAIAVILSAAIWWRVRGEAADMPEQKNPTMLRAALVFAALYAVVLIAVAWVKETTGESGLYGVAAIAGLTDVDAITLSTAQLAKSGQISPTLAWRVILIAFLSNLVFKAGIVAMLGSRRLLAIVAALFGILAGGTALLLLLYR